MAAAAATAGRGQVADYIPALASVDPDAFGMAMATFDGEIYGVGQVERPFSIQSVSKLFTLALLLAEIGDRVWQGVGREPSGNPFNSLVQLESERGIPRNPFINAGALVVTDRLLSATGDAAGAVREFLRTESGNPKLDTDRVVARSEAEQGHRNAALAYFIASYGNLQNPVDGCCTTTTRTAPSRRAAATSPWPGCSCPSTGCGWTGGGCSAAPTPSE